MRELCNGAYQFHECGPKGGGPSQGFWAEEELEQLLKPPSLVQS